MTQLSQAKNNIITNEMVLAAEKEPLTKEQLRDSIAKGLVVIPKNIKHDFSPYAVGKGTYIKVNANIGISSKKSSLDEELKKLLDPVVASGEKNFGLLMKNAMGVVAGCVDGGRVSTMLRSLMAK